jgi:hypothetical protein
MAEIHQMVQAIRRQKHPTHRTYSIQPTGPGNPIEVSKLVESTHAANQFPIQQSHEAVSINLGPNEQFPDPITDVTLYRVISFFDLMCVCAWASRLKGGVE